MIIETKIEGLEELQETLEKHVPQKLARGVMRNALKQAAEFVRQKIVERAPYRTGFLAEHFDVRVRVSSKQVEADAYIGPEGRMYYPGRGSKKLGVATGKFPHKGGLVPVASVARFLEFGTSKMAARPFMTVAFEENKDAVLIKITQSIRNALAEWLN